MILSEKEKHFEKKGINIIMLLLVGLFLSGNHAFSQDCKANFEVNAGPGIDVCENGTVQLHGIIGGDATEAIWRGGKGTFSPGRSSLETEYTPAEEEIGNGVVLILVASNPKLKCPPARSELKIKVNSQPKANAGANQRVCSGTKVKMNGSMKGKAKRTTWITNGSGTFDNAHKLDAEYTPSAEDIKKGACSIKLVAEPYGVCLEDSSAMVLSIIPSPEFKIGDVKQNTGTKPVKLFLTDIQNGKAVKWTSDGNGTFSNPVKAETTYTPSPEDANKGLVMIHVSVTSETDACETKRNIPLLLKGALHQQ